MVDLKAAATAEVTAGGCIHRVRYAPVATKFGPAPKCRYGPTADIGVFGEVAQQKAPDNAGAEFWG
jgi:hypothetical protein